MSNNIVPDWREFVEERTKTGARVLHAIWFHGRWFAMAYDENSVGVYTAIHDIILKPQPKTTRPWTPDEVPVGATVKHKANGSRHVIGSVFWNGSTHLLGAGAFDPKWLYDNYLLELTRPSGSTPGSYGVCGVEE